MSEDIQEQIRELNQETVELYHRGRYTEAIRFASQTRDLALQYLGDDHPAFAQSR